MSIKKQIAKRAGKRNLRKRPTQSILEEFFKKVTVDLGGAAGPIVMRREVKKNEVNIIIDRFSPRHRYLEIENAMEKKGVSLIESELSKKDPIPMRNKTVDHIDCRHMYKNGKIIDSRLLAKESKRILKKEGTITVSGKIEDREKMIEGFKKQGFEIQEEIKEPETRFEKIEHKQGMEILKDSEQWYKKLQKNKENYHPKAYKLYKKSYEKDINSFKEGGVFKIKFKKS